MKVARTTGVERYTVELVTALAAKEASLLVFAYPWLRPLLPENTNVVSPPAWLPRPLAQEVWLPARLARMRIRSLLTTVWSAPVAYRGDWVATVHDLVPFTHPQTLSRGARFYFRPVLRWSLRRRILRAVSTPSAITARAVDGFVSRGVPSRATYAGVARALSEGPLRGAGHEHPDGRTPCTLLFVGTVEPRKNLPFMVRVIEALRASGLDVRFHVVGRQGWGEPLPKDVDWTPSARDAQVVQALDDACLLVSPSVEEGFNLSVLEAMSRRLPAVVSRIPVHEELFSDAAVVLPLTESSWAREIADVLRNGTRYEALQTAGQARAATLSWAATADRVRTLWNSR